MSISTQLEHLSKGASELGIELTDAQTDMFRDYLKAILAWNKRRNLVSRRDEDRIGAYHFVDSLAAFRLLPREEGLRCLDIGSGAGFPGIPLKIVRPDMSLGLSEPRRWRHLFLEDVIDRLGLLDVTLLRARVEDLPSTLPLYDIGLVRAVASLRTLAPAILPRLSPGGLLIAYKSPGAVGEVEQARKGILAGGGDVRTVETMTLPVTGLERTLVVIQKSK